MSGAVHHDSDQQDAPALCCTFQQCQSAVRDWQSGAVFRSRKGSPGTPPALVCWEYQGGELPIRLSFSIKVF